MARIVLFLSVIISLLSSTSSQSCKSYQFSSNQVFKSCNDLPHLNSYLHWNYDSSSGNVQIAYRHTGASPSTWIAWAINPTGQGMVGSQALIAYQASNGNTRAYTAPIDGYQTTLTEGKLSFDVSDLTASFANNEMIIYATLGLGNNMSSVNQVWQNGPVSGGAPQIHATSGPNVQSTGSLNLLSGETTTGGGGASGLNSRIRKRNIHGVLNTVSWGIMIPLGALTARYLKVFKSADPAWFYLHASCQTAAYAVGVAGWATGLKLGGESAGIRYEAHRTIGIILFTLASLQVIALLLRPKPDNKYRLYWNIYHHLTGYAVIVLSVINIFKGFDILRPEKKWKNAYIGVIAALAFCAVWLEAVTWCIVVKRKQSEDPGKMAQVGMNGSNGVNGHGARRHEMV